MIDISELAYLTRHSATLDEVHDLAAALADLVIITEATDTRFVDPRIQALATRVAQRTSVRRAVEARGGGA
jgi:hypothetical protein